MSDFTGIYECTDAILDDLKHLNNVIYHSLYRSNQIEPKKQAYWTLIDTIATNLNKLHSVPNWVLNQITCGNGMRSINKTILITERV